MSEESFYWPRGSPPYSLVLSFVTLTIYTLSVLELCLTQLFLFRLNSDSFPKIPLLSFDSNDDPTQLRLSTASSSEMTQFGRKWRFPKQST